MGSGPRIFFAFSNAPKMPPNAASDAFHAALGFVEVGFVEVGTASIHNGSRTVRYLSYTPAS